MIQCTMIFKNSNISVGTCTLYKGAPIEVSYAGRSWTDFSALRKAGLRQIIANQRIVWRAKA